MMGENMMETKIKTLKEVEEIVKKYCEDRDWDQFHGAKELAIGISTEAAELLSHFRFKSDKEIEEMFLDIKKREDIEDEMVDILVFLARMSQKYNVDLSSALDRKMKKNCEKYPIDKFKGSNKKYTEI